MPPRSRYAGWLLAPLLVAVASTTAFAAQGINLSWGRCFGEGVGTQNRNFACNTNVGSQVMTGSFILPSDMPQVVGTEITLQLAAAEFLPAWWDFVNSGSCRPTSLSVNFVANAADIVCADWSQGQAVGGLGAYCVSWHNCGGQPTAFNVALLKIVDAVAPANAQDLTGGVEYFDFNILVDNARTAGISRCDGCTAPVCIVLNTINVVQKGNVNHPISTAAIPGSNFITWQGGGSPSTPQGNGCPAATPTRRPTWGSLKSLYR